VPDGRLARPDHQRKDESFVTSTPTNGETTRSASAADQPADQPADAAAYLAGVMVEIDAEVARRRASGELPPALERELDELFLEFSPLGARGSARLRETLALVDGAAYVDTAVPVASQKAAGAYVKRGIQKATGWYMNYVVHQVTRFSWSVSRMLHVLVDHVEDLEQAVDGLRPPDVDLSAVPVAAPSGAWWASLVVEALTGIRGRVVHGDCGDGSLVEALVAAGVDAYGLDPHDDAAEAVAIRGLDARGGRLLDHLEAVPEEALAAVVASGSVQWLSPSERDRFVVLAASRLAVGGILCLHSASPIGWERSCPPVVADLAPGRPLHPETWEHLGARHGLRLRAVHQGGAAERIVVGEGVPSSDALDALISVVNDRLLAPGEYLLVAERVQ